MNRELANVTLCTSTVRRLLCKSGTGTRYQIAHRNGKKYTSAAMREKNNMGDIRYLQQKNIKETAKLLR